MAARVKPDAQSNTVTQRCRVWNWFNDDGALNDRGTLTVCFDEESVANSWTPKPPKGRDKPDTYSDLTIQSYLNRDTVWLDLPHERGADGLSDKAAQAETVGARSHPPSASGDSESAGIHPAPGVNRVDPCRGRFHGAEDFRRRLSPTLSVSEETSSNGEAPMTINVTGR